jgi:mono/diheme cytochrome c family protein
VGLWRSLAWGLVLWGLATSVSADELSEGKVLYKQFCSHCHGLNMVNPGTSSFDLRKFPRDNKARFITSVTKGKGNMPAWGDILLPHELEKLWIYVATRGGKQPMPEERAQEHSSLETPEFLETLKTGKLTVCLPRNGGATAHLRHQGGGGFDYLVSKRLAQELSLSLTVTWYESEPEEESDPIKETYALVSHDLCDLVPGHPLYPSNIGPPPASSAALPRWLGQPEAWSASTHIPLKPLAVSRPYRRATLGLIVSPEVSLGSVKTLQDLPKDELLQIGIAQGTLSGVILDVQLPHSLKARSLMLSPGSGFLWEMEKGRFNLTLMDTAAYDFHLMQNRISKLRLHEYRHPIGFNIGIAYSASNPHLGAKVDHILRSLEISGEFREFAKISSFTYTPPTPPWMASVLTTRALISQR